jgi:hypothetical protein
MLNIYNTAGTNIIKANSIGNKTVQQNPINWSKRILGNDALTQINKNTIAEAFTPKLILYIKPVKVDVVSFNEL